MNKNIIIGLILVVIVGSGFLYRSIFLKGKICTADQGKDIEISMRSTEGLWEYDPPNLTVDKCDRVTLTIYNEDEYDHGFAIDVFGVNRRLNPETTTTIKFTASKAGEFVFYCSVPCGEGHFRHTGNIEVIEIIEPESVSEKKTGAEELGL